MDINKFVNEMNWKKALSIFGSAIVIAWCLGAIAFITIAHAVWKEYHTIVKKVDDGIAESKRDMDESRKVMDAHMKEFDNLVENQQKQTSEFFKNFDKEKEQHEKELTQSFANVEKERIGQHEDNHSKI